MPTRKIADNPIGSGCHHPDHEPASMRVYEPGLYEHMCSGCGKVTTFRVHGTTPILPSPPALREPRHWHTDMTIRPHVPGSMLGGARRF